MNGFQKVVDKKLTCFDNCGFFKTSQLHNGGFGHI